jgi:hypothetical protein
MIQEIYMIYNSLNSRYTEILDFYEALQNKKVSKFDWRIIAESSRSSSARYAETLEASKDPAAPKLIAIAKDLTSFTASMEQNVDKGTEVDWSYKEKIGSQLEALKPDMEALREKLINQ